MAKLLVALVLLSAVCGLQTAHAAGRGLLQAAPNGTISSIVPVPSTVQGYLLVTDGEANGKVTVIDLRTGGINETLQLANSSVSLYASSMGRYAFIIQRTANVTRVYDSQMYIEFHEDHWHLEQDAAPGLMERTIPGATPTHFVQRARNAAIFHDQSGEVTVLNEVLLENATYVTKSFRVDPHHGAAVPLRGNYYVVSHANQTAVAARTSSLPSGVQVHFENGSLAYDGAKEACPGLHGSATNGYHALFGCRDGVLVVTYTAPRNLTHTKIPYPVAGVYTGSLYGHQMYKTFFGLTTASGESVGVHAFDPVKLTATLVVNATADGAIISTAYDPAGAFFAVLSAANDGTLTLLNPQTGAVLRRATGVLGAAAPEAEGDDHSAVQPVIQAGLGRIYISNPESGVVNEHHADNFELLRAFNLGGHPYRMAILGPTQYWDYLYQH